MAGHLLLVVLMCFFSDMKAQALLPPKLTVSPAVITETDSVTLNCQTPSSLSVSLCYFNFVRGGPGKPFSCLKTLTGTELLKITGQSSPAEVKVTCLYLHVSSSPDSDTSSIIIRTSLPPKLTVSPAVIKDTDSVTLNCQTPSSVTVSQCNFYTLSGQQTKEFSCLKTLTATELLEISHQSSPAEVQVTCFYTVKVGELHYPSPHSGTSSITIQSNKPQLSVDHVLGDHLHFICTLPGSADGGTQCHLYFGDEVLTREIRRERTSKKQSFCQFTVTINDLLSRLRSVQQRDASCDYSLGSEPNSLSPRSDAYSLTDIVEKETHETERPMTLPVTTGLTVTKLHTSTQATSVTTDSSVRTPGTIDSSNPATPRKTASEKWIWKFVAVVTGCGVTLGVILLVSAALCNRRKTGLEGGKMCQPQNENYDAYHMYATIAEEPAASTPKDIVYSTVQNH
ncbi:uncharacterized protein LOC131969173 [Centropristis striata]|uniref:uncharacterized protein LOC131969173 n=1 Tax=Centropristis striata TaxID=184440 RepID=UPI0027E0B73A|nr:uncharacterized protein LOC131969173 [Centropristis striata]